MGITLYQAAIKAAGGAIRLRPVGCNTEFPFQLSSGGGITAGNQAGFRTMHYIPKGATDIRLLLAGGIYAGASEGANGQAFPWKLSCAVEPAPWDASQAYVAGDVVTYFACSPGSGSYNYNPYYVCVTPNTNSAPTPSNANWTYGTAPTKYPVMVSAVQDASFATQTTPDGTTVTKGKIWTDALPVSFASAGWLGIYSWLPCSASQTFTVWGKNQPLHIGVMTESGVSVVDRTTGATFGNARSVSVSAMTPVKIVGFPVSATKTVVVIGDSIAYGSTGTASILSYSIVSGGSGYQVGDILTVGRTGGSAGAVAAGSDGQFIVDAVSAGVITTLRCVNSGGYTNTATQTGQTKPTGTIVLSGGSGTGATATVTYSTVPMDPGHATTAAQGWLKRGLSSLGIPHESYTAGGDRLNLWTTAGQKRLACIGDNPADIAVVALGRNDLTAGDSQATFKANCIKFAAMLKGLGIKSVYFCTITPEVTSTTAAGCSSLADQTVTANNSVRLAVNAEMRTTPSAYGADAIIDVASYIEDGGSSAPTGKFILIGGDASAADGKHPGVSGHVLMAGAITANSTLFA